MRKFEVYPLALHKFWAWFSYIQGKKLKKPNNENLNNVLQCNFNLAKQATCEKGTWTFGGRCTSSLGGKLGITNVDDNGCDNES
jgi:hypothetical protein